MSERLIRPRRWYSALAALLLLALFASACGDDGDSGSPGGDGTGDGDTSTTAPDPGTPVEGGRAEILLYSENSTIDPLRITASGGSDAQRVFAIYGALITIDRETGEVQPVLAESFEPDATFTTWTLKLQPGLTFTDGTPFDAAAVKFNWDRIADISQRSPSLTTMLQVAGSNAVDATTLEITLSTPNAHFDKAVGRSGLNYIASPTAIQSGADLNTDPVAAGPFTLDSWIRDDRMVLSKNPDWKGSEGPYLDQLTLRVVGDEEQRIDTFNTGQVDGFYTATPSSVISATDSVDGAAFASVEVQTGNAYVFNTSKPPFDDVRVRKAFVQGVDWQAMAETVFGEGAESLTNFVTEASPFYTPDAPLPEYDPDAAQALIDEYNAENGGGPLTISMLAFQQTLDQARGRFIQTSLSQLDDVNVEVQVNDSPTNIGKVLAADYMVSSWGFPHIDPENYLWNSVFSQSFTNFPKYVNEDVDKWMTDARLTRDQAERQALYEQVYMKLAEDLPFYPYLRTVNGFVLQPDVHGGEVYDDGVLRFDLLWKSA